MTCFIGISVAQSITSSKSSISESAFQDALEEIGDFIAQTEFQFSCNDSLIVICHGHQRFYLSKSPAHLHSHLQHFVITETLD